MDPPAEKQNVPSADQDLVRRIRSGDLDAEDELARRFQPGLLAIARVRLGVSFAADLVQDTLAVGLPNLRRGDWKGIGPLAAYLAAILRRRILRLRSDPTPVGTEDPGTLPAEGVDPFAAAERVETRARLRNALGGLSSSHREVVLRHYFEGQDVNEIARETNVPRGTVLSRLHHARAKLAIALNRGDGLAHYPRGGRKR